MKITKTRLKQIIKEELQNTLNEEKSFLDKLDVFNITGDPVTGKGQKKEWPTDSYIKSMHEVLTPWGTQVARIHPQTKKMMVRLPEYEWDKYKSDPKVALPLKQLIGSPQGWENLLEVEYNSAWSSIKPNSEKALMLLMNLRKKFYEFDRKRGILEFHSPKHWLYKASRSYKGERRS